MSIQSMEIVENSTTTGCPKKIGLLSSFEFLGLGGVFLGVKNNSKNFGNKKNIRLFRKILSKWTLFYWKSSNFLEFLGVKNNSKNFGNKKNIGLFRKILSKWTLLYSKSSDLLNFYDFVHFKMCKNHSKSYYVCFLNAYMHKYLLL